jgi:hypothetical protein
MVAGPCVGARGVDGGLYVSAHDILPPALRSDLGGGDTSNRLVHH